MMFIKKMLLALSLASLFTMNVQASEPQKTTTQKTTNQKTTNQKSASNSTGNTKNMNSNTKNANAKNTSNKAATNPEAQKAAEDKNLDAFNKNVGIKLVERSIAAQDNQPVAVLNYEVTNRGKNRIKNLNWVSAFTINDQVFFLQEIKTELDKAINAGKMERITVVLPINELPENIRPVFATGETAIGHLTVAKRIDFTNGKNITVKQ